ncbi:MAG TPA: pyridoxamine 5'-phosphate oxidase family protein [Acidobacteriaceae bacterium]|nr:pyridoxamine 5'-phosphate oxidase family protein [Acidobacteriaceae bacterium]
MESYSSTERTRVSRIPKRGVYDKAQVHAILDEGFLCHVGFVVEKQPYVIPTGYVRADEKLYIHGSAASRMLRTLGNGVEICVTVTLVDGIVLARSVFHHSMNYRSVVMLGMARLVTAPEQKLDALRRFTNHIVAGRWEEARKPTDQELKATSVLALPLDEVSAKVRTGPPLDEEEDYALPIWAGVVPLRLQSAHPVPDERIMPEASDFDTGRLSLYRAHSFKMEET